MFTVKYLKQHKIFEISLSESQIFKEWHMTSFVKKKKTRRKDAVGIVTFDLIGLLPTNHNID